MEYFAKCYKKTQINKTPAPIPASLTISKPIKPEHSPS